MAERVELTKHLLGTEKGVILKGVISQKETLESLSSLKSLEPLNRIRLDSSLDYLNSLASLETVEDGRGVKRPLFQKPL